jgi:hypothetical protein
MTLRENSLSVVFQNMILNSNIMFTESNMYSGSGEFLSWSGDQTIRSKYSWFSSAPLRNCRASIFGKVTTASFRDHPY